MPAASHRPTGAVLRALAALGLWALASGNAAAQALYARFGFEAAGVRQRYYENTEDAIVMWCHGILEPPYRARLRDLCPEAAR